MLSDGLDGLERGGRWEGICVCLWLIHVDMWQKPTQFCKAIILQLRINKDGTASKLENHDLYLRFNCHPACNPPAHLLFWLFSGLFLSPATSGRVKQNRKWGETTSLRGAIRGKLPRPVRVKSHPGPLCTWGVGRSPHPGPAPEAEAAPALLPEHA